MLDGDRTPSSILRTAYAVLLPTALVATFWLIGSLHAYSERRVVHPPLSPRIAHAMPGAADSPALGGGVTVVADEDTREARLDFAADVEP